MWRESHSGKGPISATYSMRKCALRIYYIMNIFILKFCVKKNKTKVAGNRHVVIIMTRTQTNYQKFVKTIKKPASMFLRCDTVPWKGKGPQK